MIPASKTLLALAAAAALAACGGGADSPSQTQAESQPARAKVMATQAISNDQLFQWAQLTYPSLFGSAPPAVIANYPFQGRLFDVRDFGNGNYLGVSNGRAYGYGNFTNFQLVDYGAVQDFAGQVCTRINCGGSGGTGALNGCTEGASTALRVGNRFTAVYVSSVLVAPTSTGEYQIEGEVQGAALFEGQSTVKVRSRVRGSQYGQNVDSEVFAYEQAAENDLTRTFGSESSGVFGGFPATTRTVWNPASVNTEFTLAPGASLTKTESLTTTTNIPSLPFPMPPTTATSTTTYTYEGRETINVFGRSFETCRYRSVTEGSPGSTYTWHIVGRGFAARVEGRNAAGMPEYRGELKSATVNGSPL